MVSVKDFEKLSSLYEYQEPEEDYIIIKTSKGAIEANGSLYEATRRSWKADINKAKKYKYVLSVINGIVKGVYMVDKWYPDGDRIAFVGRETNDKISSLIETLIPAMYRKKGMARPFCIRRNNII